MFIKIVIVLLLLIVAASLLTARSADGRSTALRRIRPQLRILMLRVSIVLLLISAAVAILHAFG